MMAFRLILNLLSFVVLQNVLDNARVLFCFWFLIVFHCDLLFSLSNFCCLRIMLVFGASHMILHFKVGLNIVSCKILACFYWDFRGLDGWFGVVALWFFCLRRFCV